MKTKAWAFYATVYGPLGEKPFRISYSEGTESWWASDCETEVLGLGLVNPHGSKTCVTFASQGKKEVQKFVDGFMAARRLMAVFTNGTCE